jgi:hypothetical protein
MNSIRILCVVLWVLTTTFLSAFAFIGAASAIDPNNATYFIFVCILANITCFTVSLLYGVGETKS